MNIFGQDPRKSGKRETAVALFMLWMLISFALFFLKEPIAVPSYERIYDAMTYATFGFGLGAFGIHAFLNRGDKKPPQDGE